jgi:hypothetical protein
LVDYGRSVERQIFNMSTYMMLGDESSALF